jgi:hypothetical protein
MILFPPICSVGSKVATPSSSVGVLSPAMFPVVSVCGLRAPMMVNRVATRASPPYPRAICGSEKVLESSPEMRLRKVAPL